MKRTRVLKIGMATMFEMKVMRVRLRGLTVLGIVAVATVIFFYVPPVYNSHLIFTSPNPSVDPSASLLQSDETKHKELFLFGGIKTVFKNKDSSTTHASGGLPESGNIVPPAPPLKPSVDSLANIIKSDVGDEDTPLANEDDGLGYVQDYPDYTPPNFIEVEKIKPEGRSKNGEKEKSRKKSTRTTLSAPTYFSPEALRNRALSLSNTSNLRKFLEEQDRRIQHIVKTCPAIVSVVVDVESRAIGPPPGLAGVHNLLLDRVQHIAYCPVYKAASTSWTITLLEIGGYWNPKVRKNRRLQTLVSQVFPKISNFAGPALTRSMTRFMVVRHPFERLLSCYRDKFEDAKKIYYYTRYGEKMVRSYRKFPPYITSSQLGLLQEQVRAKVKAGLPVVLPGNPFAKPVGPTFPEFVAYVLRAKHDDEHWRTYYDHCSPCHMDYHAVLRFEDMNEEGKLFIEYLNRTSQVHMRWENPTQGGSTTNDVICSYYAQLSIDDIKELSLKYERDFKLFEYKPDKYFKCASDYKEKSQTTST